MNNSAFESFPDKISLFGINTPRNTHASINTPTSHRHYGNTTSVFCLKTAVSVHSSFTFSSEALVVPTVQVCKLAKETRRVCIPTFRYLPYLFVWVQEKRKWTKPIRSRRTGGVLGKSSLICAQPRCIKQ